MGLYESLGPGGRSEGSVNQLADVFQRHLKQKRENERREKIRELLSTPTGDLSLSSDLQADVDALKQPQPPVQVDPQRRQSGTMGIRSVADQPARMETRLRGPSELSLDEIFKMGEILGQGAGGTVGMVERAEQARQPKYGVEEVEGELYETRTGRSGVDVRKLGGPGKRPTGTHRWVDSGKTEKRGEKEFVTMNELDPSGRPTGNTRPGVEVSASGGSGKVPDALKELNKIRTANQELFDKVQTLETSNIYRDAEGNEIEADEATAQKLREGWLSAMKDNENMMNTLAPKAGKRLKVVLKAAVDGHAVGTEGEIDADEFDSRIMQFKDVIE